MTTTSGCAGDAGRPAPHPAEFGARTREPRFPTPPSGCDDDGPDPSQDLSPVLRVMRIWTTGRPPAPRPRAEVEERAPG
ncbi:hypothetical protein AB0465_28815 [Streptomyces griseoviridis]|uniref:hypothetical protein n=1 Tax=Streptomyces griseoviridis TaxID=45398 RepID=UPI00344E7EE3